MKYKVGQKVKIRVEVLLTVGSSDMVEDIINFPEDHEISGEITHIYEDDSHPYVIIMQYPNKKLASSFKESEFTRSREDYLKLI